MRTYREPPLEENRNGPISVDESGKAGNHPEIRDYLNQWRMMCQGQYEYVLLSRYRKETDEWTNDFRTDLFNRFKLGPFSRGILLGLGSPIQQIANPNRDTLFISFAIYDEVLLSTGSLAKGDPPIEESKRRGTLNRVPIQSVP